jgi:hypothetical protein
MPGQAGGGLAQKVGPLRKYLGYQNCPFTFVKHLTVARCRHLTKTLGDTLQEAAI